MKGFLYTLFYDSKNTNVSFLKSNWIMSIVVLWGVNWRKFLQNWTHLKGDFKIRHFLVESRQCLKDKGYILPVSSIMKVRIEAKLATAVNYATSITNHTQVCARLQARVMCSKVDICNSSFLLPSSHAWSSILVLWAKRQIKASFKITVPLGNHKEKLYHEFFLFLFLQCR